MEGPPSTCCEVGSRHSLLIHACLGLTCRHPTAPSNSLSIKKILNGRLLGAFLKILGDDARKEKAGLQPGTTVIGIIAAADCQRQCVGCERNHPIRSLYAQR